MARGRVRKSSPAKHRAQAGAPRRESGGLRGRRRRASSWDRFVGWLGFGRRTARKRELLEGQLRELRLATAALKAEISVLRHELEQAMALAAERRAETVRMAALLPLVHRSFAAARSAAISLDYSPEVAQLDAVNGKVVLDLEANRANVSEIVLPVHPAAAAQRLDLAATGDQRRTA